MALPSITDDDIAEQMKMMAAFQNRGHLASGLPLLRRVHERGTYFVPGLFDASVLASLYTFVGAMVPPTRVYQALEADEHGKPICLVSDYGGPSVFLVAGCVDAASPHPRAPHLRARPGAHARTAHSTHMSGEAKTLCSGQAKHAITAIFEVLGCVNGTELQAKAGKRNQAALVPHLLTAESHKPTVVADSSSACALAPPPRRAAPRTWPDPNSTPAPPPRATPHPAPPHPAQSCSRIWR